MERKAPFTESMNRAVETFVPYISVDCIIMGFDAGCIKILLCKRKESDKWLLTGGFIRRDEGPDDSAYRILESKTGIGRDGFLKQFYFFNKKCNAGDDENLMMLKRLDVEEIPENMVNLGRFVSLSYYLLVKYQDVEIAAEEYEELEWFDINALPELYGTHGMLINLAVSEIRKQVGFIPFGYELLPDKFTMPELRSIYEAILGRELDRRNFQRKMLSIGYIQPLNEVRKEGAHKSPHLYTFVKEKYRAAKIKDVQLMSNNL
ncbi:NUDIX domain-containing protein [Dysgonomonas sp. Marseille-P4361]|uniref:NUDIX hydrolase n=1 Tax=Dysgonomonas sp. Marseille-P4361 TaxID=2161820 RepID=UPI000D54C500|nr:NUDIX domain-containing protein [Dysgonomonas sp. Marseille-P4361]